MTTEYKISDPIEDRGEYYCEIWEAETGKDVMQTNLHRSSQSAIVDARRCVEQLQKREGKKMTTTQKH